MSSGHHTHPKFGISTEMLNRLYSDKQVEDNYHRDYTINKDYDLPYLGGFSIDGHTIYFDRHLPDEIGFDLDGKKYKFCPEHTIPYHERFEKAVMDALGWTYSAAHQAANANERRHTTTMGLPWTEYNKALEPYIKADEHEKLKKLPPDLDMRPYLEPPVDHKLVAHMQKIMGHADSKDTH